MIRAIGYIRVSTDQQDFERQRSEINDYAQRNNFTVIKVFEDKQSGSDYEDRAGFQNLLLYLEENPEVKVVIFDEVSRMGRDTANQVTTYKLLTKKGIRIFTRGKGEFGNNKEDSLLFTVLSAIADYEKQTIIDRTGSGRRKVVKDGFTQMSQKPFGYNLLLTVKKDRHVSRRQFIEINPVESKIVRKMFTMIDDGYTVYDILKTLANSNIRPPKGGLKWGKSSVMRILHSTTYYGEWRFGKMVKNGKSKFSLSKRKEEDLITVPVPGIISKELFERTQQKLLSRKYGLNPKNQKNIYLLKGITRCNCNHSLSCYFNNRTNIRTYRCPQRNIDQVEKKECPIKNFKADFVEMILILELKKKIENPNFFKDIRKGELKKNQQPINDLKEQLQELEAESKKKEKLLQAYYEKMMILSTENPEKALVFEKLADDLMAENKELKDRLIIVTTKLNNREAGQIDVGKMTNIKKALQKITAREAKEFDEGNQLKKLEFVRKYIREIRVKYLEPETMALRNQIGKIRDVGLFKRENTGLKPIYRMVFNKDHQHRTKTAIQVLAIEVMFVNNYPLLIELPYFHENPEMAVSYLSNGVNILMNKISNDKNSAYHYQG